MLWIVRRKTIAVSPGLQLGANVYGGHWLPTTVKSASGVTLGTIVTAWSAAGRKKTARMPARMSTSEGLQQNREAPMVADRPSPCQPPPRSLHVDCHLHVPVT